MPKFVKTPRLFEFDASIKLEIENLSEALAEIKSIMKEAVDHAFKKLVDNFESIIITPLIFGGKGWYGIVNTQAWKWINSPQGYGQLGFSSPGTPYQLITAYLKSWEVSYVDGGLKFNFGDIEKIRAMTKHPYAGKGNLPSDRTWFDWIYDGQHRVTEPAKFRRTGPRKGVRSSKIAGQSAGRMIKYKKPGSLWKVKPIFKLDMDYFLDRNRNKIISTIEKFIAAEISEYIGK